jgi:LEA14-like dessication related protein
MPRLTLRPNLARGIALLLALTLTGCAQVLRHTDPPRVSLVNLQLVEATLFEQRFEVDLRLQNPNPFPLPLAGMSYALDLNDSRFAEGVSNTSVVIPAYGESVIGVQVSSNLGGVLEQLYRLQRGEPPEFRYRLAGSVSLVDQAFRLPFERTGEIRLTPPETR